MYGSGQSARYFSHVCLLSPPQKLSGWRHTHRTFAFVAFCTKEYEILTHSVLLFDQTDRLLERERSSCSWGGKVGIEKLILLENFKAFVLSSVFCFEKLAQPVFYRQSLVRNTDLWSSLPTSRGASFSRDLAQQPTPRGFRLLQCFVCAEAPPILWRKLPQEKCGGGERILRVQGVENWKKCSCKIKLMRFMTLK